MVKSLRLRDTRSGDHEMSGKTMRKALSVLAGLSLAMTAVLPARGSSEPGPLLALSFSYAPDGNRSQAASGEDKKKPATPTPTVQANGGRAFFEIGILMAYSQTRYWLNYAKFIEDWQFHFSWKDQRRRFFSFKAWMFDSNAFSLNWTHSFAGMLYYQFGRTNGLSWPRSFLFSLGGSLWWEYVAEWREIISLNDNIMTSTGGFAAGEAWFQLGKYFIGRQGLLERFLSFAVNPVLKFNHWLDLRKGRNRSLGPEPGWHDFRLFVGRKKMPTSAGTGPQRTMFVGFHTRIIHAPEYGRPERSGRIVTDTLASDLDVDFALRHGRIEEFNFSTRVAGLGYYRQEIGPDRKGYAYYIGMGSAFTLFKKKSISIYDSGAIPVKKDYDLHLQEPRQFTDKMAAVHVAGPVFDYTAFTPKSRLRLVLDAYLDFGLINAFALNPYSEEEDIRGVKTTLLYYGYYYGIGTTLVSDLTYRYRALQFGGRLRYSTYGSIEGLDRFQNDITDDFHLKDDRLACRLEAAVRLPWAPVEVLASYEGIGRRGTAKDVRRRDFEDRYAVCVAYKF
jgi:hypothetical protein